MSFVSELNGASPEPATNQAATPETVVTETGAETGGESTQVDESAASGTEADETTTATAVEIPEGVLAEIAKELELNLEDPAQRIIAERAAQREMRAQEAQEPEVEESLTEFEKSLLQPPTEDKGIQQPPGQQLQQQQQVAQGPQQYGDIGDTWKGPHDALVAEADAWEDVRLANENKQDTKMAMDRVHAIRHAQFVRMADATLTPYIRAVVPRLAQQMFEQMVQERFGDVLPHIQGSIQDRQYGAAKEAAMTDLEKLPAYKGVRDLYKADATKPTLKYKGEDGKVEEFPNTPLNAILIANPDLLKIRVDHKDPQIAYRLTATAMLKAVMRIANNGKLSSKTVKSVMAAGAKANQQANLDKTRQGLNSGKGASVNGSGSNNGGLISTLNSVPGGGKSFSSLFDKK